jgi:phosphoglycerate dehydrogenase-like enzyme
MLTVFNDHVSNANEIVERLAPFDGVCIMRERTPLTREILARLPQLKLIASTGATKCVYRSRRGGLRDRCDEHQI